jgi:antitoxin YefM
MAAETTYTALRGNLASYLDQVTDNREVLIVRRRGARDVAIVPSDELSGLMETAHLLRAPKNAQRLLRALKRAVEGEGAAEPVASLRHLVESGPARSSTHRA